MELRNKIQEAFNSQSPAILDFAEQLYTARGAQGIITSGLPDTLYALEPDLENFQKFPEENELGSILLQLSIETDTNVKKYHIRPTSVVNFFPGFFIPGLTGRSASRFDSLLSLPMYAKYAKLRFEQIPFSKLLISLKDKNNKAHYKFIEDAIKTTLEQDGLKDQYKIWSYANYIDSTVNVSDYSCFSTYFSLSPLYLFCLLF